MFKPPFSIILGVMFKTTKQTTLKLKLTIPPFKGNSCLKVLKIFLPHPPCWQKKTGCFFCVCVLISKDSAWFWKAPLPKKKTRQITVPEAPYMATSKLPTSCKACWIG